MPLLSTKKHPPKGWVYRETIAGKYWTNPDPMLPFDDVARALCAARANNNMKTTLADCRAALGAYTCRRLDNDGRWCVQEGSAQAKARAAVALAAAAACCGRKKKAR